MSISDYMQMIFILQVPAGMVYNEIQDVTICLGIMDYMYFCI